jgi:hypothetical protein
MHSSIIICPIQFCRRYPTRLLVRVEEEIVAVVAVVAVAVEVVEKDSRATRRHSQWGRVGVVRRQVVLLTAARAIRVIRMTMTIRGWVRRTLYQYRRVEGVEGVKRVERV